MTGTLYEPLNLAVTFHRHRFGATDPTLGSWFSEAIHHVTGTPDAKAQQAQVDQFKSQVTDAAVTQIVPLLQQGQATASALPGAVASAGLDSFLSANRGLLMAAGAGLLLIVLLKPRHKSNGSSVAFMPMPISSPQSGKGK